MPRRNQWRRRRFGLFGLFSAELIDAVVLTTFHETPCPIVIDLVIAAARIGARRLGAIGDSLPHPTAGDEVGRSRPRPCYKTHRRTLLSWDKVYLTMHAPNGLGVDLFFAEWTDTAVARLFCRNRGLAVFAPDSVSPYLFLAEWTLTRC